MPTERKVAQVHELEDRLRRAVITIGINYRGLTVAQLRQLRTTLRATEPNMELRVVKNSLAKRAAEGVNQGSLSALLQETTALLFGYAEIANPSKAVAQYARDTRSELPIYGGYLDGALLTPAEVSDLASLPSRPQLMAKIAGGITSPLAGLAGALTSVLREVAAVIDARAAQLEAGGGAPAVPQD